MSTMHEITLNKLDHRLQKQIENARKSIRKNPAFAINVLGHIVHTQPACLEVRELLRQAQFQLAGAPASKGTGFLSKIGYAVTGMRLAGKIKKDAAAALVPIEVLIAKDVYQPEGHRYLAEAASVLGLKHTQAFALEQLVAVAPDSVQDAKNLIRLYIELGQSQDALRVADRAQKAHVMDEELQSLARKAAVEQSINKGKWDSDQSFRDKLKDEEQAQKLEQAGRAKTGEAGLRSLVETCLEAIKASPENITHYRDLIAYYRDLGELEDALKWLVKARQLEVGQADVNLQRLESELRVEQLEQAIQQKKDELAQDPQNAALSDAIDALRQKSTAFQLEQIQALVQRYPNDFSYRFEYGQLLFAQGELDAAIKELQLAQRSPQVRIDALVLLGEAYQKKGFLDLAIEQLLIVKDEVPGMTDQKKAILYQLGRAYEEQGEMDFAIGEYKLLYGADIAYRDVADKIDTFYSTQAEADA